MESNMDIINDMFSDNLIYDEQDEINMIKGETKEYYIGKAEYILSLLDNDNYFEFLKVFSKKFRELDLDKQSDVKEVMGIRDKTEIIYKEKIVYKDKKNTKPKINNYDDY